MKTMISDICALPAEDLQQDQWGQHGQHCKSNNPNPNPNAMGILAVKGQMTEAEWTCRMPMGLCFRCNKHSHLLRNCLTKPKGKSQEQVRVDALEEELKGLKEGLARPEKREGRSGDTNGSKNGTAWD